MNPEMFREYDIRGIVEKDMMEKYNLKNQVLRYLFIICLIWLFLTATVYLLQGFGILGLDSGALKWLKDGAVWAGCGLVGAAYKVLSG